MNKNRGMLKKLLVCFPLLLCLLLMKETVAAAGGISIELPVSQLFTIENSNNESLPLNYNEFQYTLTAKEPGNPMPEGSSGGTYGFTIKGEKDMDLPPMVFENTGRYQYQLELTGIGTNDNYTYDQEVYTITVYIKDQGSGILSAEVTAARSNGEKVDRMAFHNRYKASVPDPEVPKPDVSNPKVPTPAKPIGHKKPANIVRTGDNTNLVLWAVLLLTSGLYLTVIFIKKQKEKSRK